MRRRSEDVDGQGFPAFADGFLSRLTRSKAAPYLNPAV